MPTTELSATPEDVLSLLISFAKEKGVPAVGFRRSLDASSSFPSFLSVLNDRLPEIIDPIQFTELINDLILDGRLVQSQGQNGGTVVELTQAGFDHYRSNAENESDSAEIKPEYILTLFSRRMESTGKSAALTPLSMNMAVLNCIEKIFDLKSNMSSLHKASKVCMGKGWIKKKYRSGNEFDRLFITEQGIAQLDYVFSPSSEDTRSSNPEKSDWDIFSKEIKEHLSAAKFDPSMKSVIEIDLNEATKAYQGDAYKACVVMLGACLEGFMVGTVQRPEVIRHLRNDQSKFSKLLKSSVKCGLADPEFEEKLKAISFEDMKNVIIGLIPDIERHSVENIQSYRNTIHPNVSAVKQELGIVDRSTAVNYLTGLVKMSKIMIDFES